MNDTQKLAINNRRIPSKEYYRFIESMPICCVDAIIVHDSKFLLVKRTIEPAKGKWWLPGGRILKGEDFIATLKRKCFEETGIIVKKHIFVDICSATFKESVSSSIKSGTHTINLTYAVFTSMKDVHIDSTSSVYKWAPLNKKTGNDYIDKLISKYLKINKRMHENI